MLTTVPLIFATNNAHKVLEMKHLFGHSFQILSLKEAGIDIDIPEPFDTLEENAVEKCRVIFERTGTTCFAEDTGLEVEAMAGQPGVKTARFAGEHASADQNMDKLLLCMQNKTNRQAQFKTIIALMTVQGERHLFEGVCKGSILAQKQGDGGFGYDPIFLPQGHTRSFAQMSLDEKKAISHRGLAFEKLLRFLQKS
ncbi:MAG: RdgB/HAM1 family non-canonical purine NTP pyrophosphatase [Bacteroidetes bacterium]|nr:MAG: RdgB/HAM1 family non-canonical purine NTP pyrophosphatase [Bacteroidota bacterium]